MLQLSTLKPLGRRCSILRMSSRRIVVGTILSFVTYAILAAQRANTTLPPLLGSAEVEIIGQAEKEGAGFLADPRPPLRVPKSFQSETAAGTAERRCVVATGKGPVRSGEFMVGGDLTGVARAWALKKVPPKLWWAPLHHAPTMSLVVRGKQVGSTEKGEQFKSTTVAWPVSAPGVKVPEAERDYFFPTEIRFLRDGGKWILVATQGADWGCFVLTIATYTR